jgi:hypothetical protein
MPSKIEEGKTCKQKRINMTSRSYPASLNYQKRQQKQQNHTIAQYP